MPYPQVTITRLTGQLGRLGAGSGENVAALVMGGVAVSGKAQLSTIYKLYSVAAAEALGLDAAYDTANKVLVHYHISEFFRMNPTGELHIMLITQDTSMEDMCDKTNNYLKKVLRDGAGRIRKAGVVLNPTSSYTSTTSGGLDADVLAAIPKAQALADEEYAAGRPINNIVIEGREFNGTVGDATDLKAINGGPFRDVSVVIAQDPAVASADALFADYAAVGTYLGVATNKEASESFAQAIDQFNLTNTAESKFLSSYLSNNNPLSNLSDADIAALDAKGYIFGRTFPNYDGVYFNQSHVCAPLTDDYAYSELRDVMNRAVRITRPVMIPYINSTDFTVENGRIVKRQTKMIEAEIRQALTAMQNDYSSIPTVIVDPEFDDAGQAYPSFLSDNKLRVIIGIVPKGKAVEIFVNIGFTQ